ncbi:MAG: SDR family oxidoreductase, partial [Chloroflexi bacterium]|nr:SDR family oxidoreductase [Chloroflexota bacterium]
GADATCASIERCGRRVYFEALDLTDLAAARRFARDSIRALGGLNALVNNAGTDFYRGVAASTREDIEAALGLNFYHAWALSQEAYPALKEAGGGMVVNIASTHAERTNPGTFPYNMSKAALVALTKSLAIEWGRDNIRAVAVAPALVYVPPIETYLNSLPDRAAVTSLWESRYPLGRGGQPDEVAALVVCLLGEAGRFVSGTTITVDGGLGALMETPERYLTEHRRRWGRKSGGLSALRLVSGAVRRRARERLGGGRR